MNIGIIVYSQTGHTKSLAEQLKEALKEKGHSAGIEEITISGEASPGKFQMTAIPSVDGYDALIFGAPVHGFKLSSVMEAYLQQMPDLKGKEVALLVTKQLPFLWTGGTGANNTMKQICQEKNAHVKGAEVAIWSDKKREASVRKCVRKISDLF